MTLGQRPKAGGNGPRVLQVHHFRYPTVRGGVDRAVTEIINGLGPEQCTLFEVGDWPDRRLSRRQVDGVTVYRRRLRQPEEAKGVSGRLVAWAEFLVALLQLAALLRRERIAVVHLHTLQDYHRYFGALTRLRLCRVLITLHGTETAAYPDRPAHQRQRWRSALADAGTVAVVSASLGREARARLPLHRPPVVVRNGIGDPAQAEGATREQARPARPYVLCVGALRHIKGHELAITAWAEVNRQHPDLELLIAGEGERRDTLLGLARDTGCADRIRLLGQQSHRDVLALTAGAEIFLMPSRTEGLGIALLEAAALSRPIVAADIPAFREIIRDGREGLLFAPGDWAALARRVTEIAADPPRGNALGAAARERFLASFERQRMLRKYRRLYRGAAA